MTIEVKSQLDKISTLHLYVKSIRREHRGLGIYRWVYIPESNPFWTASVEFAYGTDVKVKIVKL